jgi:thiamine pyrophosphate-dependent acetolactate synthase large subunit-like protein
MGCDLLLMVGTDYPYSNFLPSKGTVIQVDERPHVLGRRAPTVLGVAGSARPTLKLLLDQVACKNNTRFWDKVTQERQKWDEMLDKEADPARSEDRIHPQAVARAVSERYSFSTPVSTHSGRATGSGKVDRSGLSVPSTTGPWERRLVRPTGCKRWIARAR